MNSRKKNSNNEKGKRKGRRKKKIEAKKKNDTKKKKFYEGYLKYLNSLLIQLLDLNNSLMMHNNLELTKKNK